MSSTNFLDRFIYSIIKYFGTVEENSSKDLGNPEKILIIRQHNQLGDLLASVSLFRAIKEKYPKCNITLVVSPANCIAVAKNKFIDRTFIFDKKKIFTLSYFKNLRKLLNEGYDLVIVPSTVSISFTSI
jgi:heptosyltransferase-2